MDKKLGLEIMGSILLDSAMLMVVLLHNLLNGEILSFHSAAPQNMFYWFIENLALVAVNLFAMITGFLMVDRNIKLKKLGYLWLIICFGR